MRRISLMLLALVASVVLLLGCANTEPETNRDENRLTAGEPNVVMVMLDDAHYSVVNNMPNTTNLLNNQGVEFTNMTFTYPLCCPSRATMFSGQYVHNHGVYDNRSNSDIAPDGGWERYKQVDLPSRELACWINPKYETALFGKYINNYQETFKPACWDKWYGWNAPQEGWGSVNNDGVVQNLGAQVADVTTADRAISYINNYTKTDPLFMWASFGAPHKPYYYEPEWANSFTTAQVPRTPAFNETDRSDKPNYIKNNTALSAAEIAALDNSYRESLRSAQQVDKFVSNLVTALQNKNMLSNTYIMFYNDNGDHFGEYALFEGKSPEDPDGIETSVENPPNTIGGAGKSTPYLVDNESPFYIRGPGVAANVNSPRLVGNQDIPVTIADIANVEPPGIVDGRSFLPLLGDPATAAWSRQVLFSEKINPGQSATGIPHWRMVRTETLVYVKYFTGEEEFYDVSAAADPWQVNNNPANAPLWMKNKLNELANCAATSCRTAENTQ